MHTPIINVTLTHWGRVTHICVGNLTIIGSDNGLSPDRRQAITWTNVGIMLIVQLGTNFNENLSEIHSFSFKKMHLKMSSAKWRLFRLGLNELNMVICIILRRISEVILSCPIICPFVRIIRCWYITSHLRFVATLPLPWASVHWLVQCTLECHWNATGWPSVHWNTTGKT